MKQIGFLMLALNVTVLVHAQDKATTTLLENTPQLPATHLLPYHQGTQVNKANPMFYANSWISLSNYGQPAVLIMGLGDTFNGQVATFHVCDKWLIRQESGTINWNDQAPPTQMFFIPPLGSGLAATVKTPQKSGRFTVDATISAVCGDWWRHGDISDVVRTTAPAIVYDSIPVTNLLVNCGTTSGCTTVKGGQSITATVTNQYQAPAQSPGTVVWISSSGPGAAPAYMIETTGTTTVGFPIQTSPVLVNTPLTVFVSSGGVTLAASLTVTP